MKKLASEFKNLPVYTVHSGSRAGIINKLLVRQSDLKLELLELSVPTQLKKMYLLVRDIRFGDNSKLIIDSHQNLSEADELLRHKSLLKTKFNLLGASVITQSGKKLGKVKDFAFDILDFFVSSLYVSTVFWKKWLYKDLIIDRSAIIDIKKNTIIVTDNLITTKQKASKVLPVKS